jgi:aminoglycoside phosphotransferase family enzyme/predicted kinase
MLVGDQSDAIVFLRNLPGEAEAELISTHASLVFLIGDRAFKLKRAVRYPYLDFSTPERRLAYCRAELDLNRRTAPQLYLAVRTITRRTDGGLEFDGTGPLVDALIEMRRFGQDALLDTMARRGALTKQHISALAGEIAALHRRAAVNYEHGGAAGIAAVLDINDRGLRGTSLVDEGTAGRFADLFRAAFKQHAEKLDQRRAAGKVRRCHGDLILRNICLLDGVPTLFDCLEFDEALATIDVLYDLAFLLMDLWHRDQRELANFLYNRYLDDCDETDGLSLVPFFMAIRAAVRAHVTAVQADNAPPEAKEPLRTEALAYFDLALEFLKGSRPMLVAIGGFSGTGKSTVASLAAPSLGAPPGARTLNTDRIRKRIHGVRAETRLPKEAYRPDVSERVYAMLRQEAAGCLGAGGAVVVDGVFDRVAERTAVEAVAEAASVPFRGFWLEAPAPTLTARVATRQNDPSDATAEVVTAQMERDCGEIGWQRIDTSGDPTQIQSAILKLLGVTS